MCAWEAAFLYDPQAGGQAVSGRGLGRGGERDAQEYHDGRGKAVAAGIAEAAGQFVAFGSWG